MRYSLTMGWSPMGEMDRRGMDAVREPAPTHERVSELERENSRLQRLVAELLVKNQRLRERVTLAK